MENQRQICTHCGALVPMIEQRNESSVLFTLKSLPSLSIYQDEHAVDVEFSIFEEEDSGVIDLRKLARTWTERHDCELVGLRGIGVPTNSATLSTYSSRGDIKPGRRLLAVAAGVLFGFGLAQFLVFSQPTSVDTRGIEAELLAMRSELALTCPFVPSQTDPSPVDREARPSKPALAADSAKTPRSTPSRVMLASARKREADTAIQVARKLESSTAPQAVAVAVSMPAEETVNDLEKQQRPEPTQKNDELDRLLDASTRASVRVPRSDAENHSGSTRSRKVSLERTDVRQAMARVANDVKRCSNGQEDSITLEVGIGRDGKTRTVEVTGKYAGSPIGDCAAHAVRSAVFPESQSELTISYPFGL